MLKRRNVQLHGFAPIILTKKTLARLDANSNEKVIFDKIELGKIVDSYAKRALWPIELKAEVSIEPQGAEVDLQNNTTAVTLKIPLPPY